MCTVIVTLGSFSLANAISGNARTRDSSQTDCDYQADPGRADIHVVLLRSLRGEGRQWASGTTISMHGGSIAGRRKLERKSEANSLELMRLGDLLSQWNWHE